VTPDVQAELDAHYYDLQSAWSVDQRPDLGPLVVPNGNGSTPVHRWFRMKESFSCDLLANLLADSEFATRTGITVWDPFVGAGTTGVSLAHAIGTSSLEAARFTGYETNPYLHLVASTKLRALQTPPANFVKVAQRMGALVAGNKVSPVAVPGLSTFSREDFFERSNLRELLTLRAALDTEIDRGSDELSLDLARLCLASIVEPSSYLRRDGRAMRHEPNKPVDRPLAAFLRKAGEVEADLPDAPICIEGSVYRADIREKGALARAVAVPDVILFSPPYPNNIDYTEVYKLEAWLLGYYDDSESFAEQRRRTIRSHGSLDFGEESFEQFGALAGGVRAIVEPLLRAVPQGRYAGARRRTIAGYAADLFTLLRALAAHSVSGTRLVYIVGNSLHGGKGDDPLLIAADLIIAALAEVAGFAIDGISVARYPSRRRTRSPFLRESVVFGHRTTAAAA
jgi:hypothetical protein